MLKRFLPLVLLVLPISAAAQVSVTTTPGASLCPEIPRPGVGVPCIDVPAGTELEVSGPIDAEWLSVVFSGQQRFVAREKTVRVDGPCADRLYRELKARELSSLSEREYQYMLERDRACAEYQRTVLANQPQHQLVEEARQARKQASNFIALSAVLSLVAGFITYFAVR